MMDSELRAFQKNLPMALLRARETVMGHFRPLLRSHDITEQQWRVIRALYGKPGLEVSALADKTLLLMPSLTRILKALEEREFVTSSMVEGDNRRKLIRLDHKGRAVHQMMSPLSEAEYKKIEAKLGAKKLKTLYQLLNDLSD